MPDLKLYNSLTRKKEVFRPLNPSHVRLYACGPTVYNYAHIGNARMAVAFDLLTRVLKTQYERVTYVSNITDVDDKIMAAAKETGEPIDVITEKYTDIYNEDMAALGCAEPDIQPRATTHIEDMITLIARLIERGHAYAAEGHVLFNVPSFPAYGGLSGRSRDEQIAGARVEIASYKKDPADFVLWKPSAPEEPGWGSPWGRGRPGWHIECSAMAEKHLGLPFDIHGGGADLKFPHHENEIAQSCCAHGYEHDLSAFAKMWVHNGFVTVEGEKMSKSLGNVTLAHDLLAGKPKSYGMILRLALLSAQYRKPLDWSAQAIHQAEKLYAKIGRAFEKLKDVYPDEEVTDSDDGVMAALYDDLNTPLALSKLNALISTIMNTESRKPLPILKAILLNSLDVLGVQYIEGEINLLPDDEGVIENKAVIDALVKERTQAKKDKNFARADEIRDELAAMNIEIIDTPEGPVWKKKE
ncbi:MAG: cysteine--tRNA ligase [Alphaproteobacteria bacterium]